MLNTCYKWQLCPHQEAFGPTPGPLNHPNLMPKNIAKVSLVHTNLSNPGTSLGSTKVAYVDHT